MKKENRFELHRLPILLTFLNYLSILFPFSKNNSLLRKVSEEIISKGNERMRSQEKDQTKRD